MKNLLTIPVSVIIVLIFAGCCTYSTYSIQTEDVPPNPYNVKFYLEDMDYYIYKGPEKQKFFNALVEKYPDYFTNDKTKGIPIVFTWLVSVNRLGWEMNPLLCGFTYGLIPFMGDYYFYSSITANYSGCEKITECIDRCGYVYKTNVKYVENPLFFLSIISFPITAGIIANRDDVDIGIFSNGSEYENLGGYSFCETNLKLFPLACLQMMERPMTMEELQIGSKYFPHMQELLANLSPEQKESLIAQETVRKNQREQFISSLDAQSDYELQLINIQSQQIMAAVQTLQSVQPAILAAGNIINASYQPAETVKTVCPGKKEVSRAPKQPVKQTVKLF